VTYSGDTNNTYTYFCFVLGQQVGRRYRGEIKTTKQSFHSLKTNPGIPRQTAEGEEEVKILIQLTNIAIFVKTTRF
jgi:predicted phage tail protein